MPQRAESPLEHQEQAILIKWTEYAGNSPGIPKVNIPGKGIVSALSLIYAIPNGGQRYKKTAATLKAEGVKAGVPDLCLPYPCGGYHGLYIEMKRVKTGKLSQEQSRWLTILSALGYRCEVCYGFEDARKAILHYLGGHNENTKDP